LPTHGSLSKAGKVRDQTNRSKVQPTVGLTKKSKNPRQRNRRNFEVREELTPALKRYGITRKIGQNPSPYYR
jgi:ribosomal protein S30